MSVKKIRELNDELRKTFSGGKFVITPGVDVLSDMDKEILFNKLKNFSSFNEHNDPYKEHDFGCIKFKGEQYFFKIDYYDVDYRCLSPEPSDPAVTCRVLTLMKAEEY